MLTPKSQVGQGSLQEVVCLGLGRESFHFLPWPRRKSCELTLTDTHRHQDLQQGGWQSGLWGLTPGYESLARFPHLSHVDACTCCELRTLSGSSVLAKGF